jgi:hypothetical protein
MKNTLLIAMKSLVIVILLTWVFAMNGQGQRTSYADSWGKHGVSLLQQHSSSVSLNVSVEDYVAHEKEIRGESSLAITIPGVLMQGQAGAPDIPVYSKYVAVPQGASVKAAIKRKRTESTPDINIAPAPVIPKDTDRSPLKYEKDRKVFQRNAFYPENIVTVSELQKIRGVDVVLISVSPFQYNPVTKELLVHRDMEVELSFEGGSGQFGEDRLRSRWWDPIIRDMVINEKSLPEITYPSVRNRAETGAEYVIITPDDDIWLKWADSIRNFRIKQGISTEIYTTSDVGGNTNQAIEGFINDAYQNWTIPPAAVLLMADYGSNGTTINSPIYNNYCISDNIFADVDNDHLPDVIFARMTAQNEDHLETMVTKFLNYERNPPTNPGYYDHPITAMGWQTERWFQLCSEIIAGYFENEHGKATVRENAIYSGSPSGGIWSTATNTSTILDVFGEDGLGYVPDDPGYLTDWGGNATRINNDINDGAFILQHRDHGSTNGWGEPAYSSSDINGLTNEDLTFIFSINCLTGKFNLSGECFAEKFHRHEFGALGITAATEVSYSFVNDTYVWGMYDNMWPDFMPQFGTEPESRDVLPAFGNAAGKYFLQQSGWPYNSNSKEVTYYLFHHHGDAFSTVYYEVPEYLTVNHDEVMLAGLDYFTVAANEGAFICLSIGDEILGVAESTGSPLEIAIPAQEPGTLIDIVITKQNFYRYENTIEVIPPDGPYCMYYDHTLNDSCGNGNNQPEYDEELLFSMVMKNLGNETAVDVDVVLSANDSYVDFIDDTEHYDSIVSGGYVDCEYGYKVQLSNGIPDMHRIQFNVTATDANDSSWSSKFFVVAKAPKLKLGKLIVDDKAEGNDNGRLDPGETANIKIATSNIGHCVAYDVACELIAYNPYITVNSEPQTIPVLAMLGASYPTFSVTVAEDAPNAVMAEMHYEVKAAGYTAIDYYYPKIGIFLEDWETGDFDKYDWAADGDQPWEVTMDYPYEGFFHASSGPIGNNETAEFSITYEVMSSDDIKFYRKVSSELDSDKLKFYVDGNLRGTWSGTSQGYRQESFPITPGNHTFKWVYQKNGGGTGGTDKAWIDYIELPSKLVTTLFAGIDAEVCEGSDFYCNGNATNQDSVFWSTSGDGSFNNINILYPVYTPGEQDLLNGEAILTLGLIDQDGEEHLDEMTLTISSTPEAPEMPDGPEYIDVYKDIETFYTIPEVPEASGYSWVLEPEDAGILQENGNSVTVTWNIDFLGEATLKASVMNECGEGDYSEGLIIIVDNTVGFRSSDENLRMVVAPNPNNGTFKLMLNTADAEPVNIRFVSYLGNEIMRSEQVDASASYSFVFSQENLPQGVYILIAEHKGKYYSRKVLIAR